MKVITEEITQEERAEAIYKYLKLYDACKADKEDKIPNAVRLLFFGGHIDDAGVYQYVDDKPNQQEERIERININLRFYNAINDSYFRYCAMYEPKMN